jgi:aspartyl aminopeptidase
MQLCSNILIHLWIKYDFQDKHEENHKPKLHGGLVIKHNANQRYATNAVTAFIFREIAERHQLPIQVSERKKKDLYDRCEFQATIISFF